MFRHFNVVPDSLELVWTGILPKGRSVVTQRGCT
jgi:hypothetical protein